MELVIGRQVAAAAACVLLGFALGCVYDLLRALRPGAGLTARIPGDILFCLLFFLTTFIYAAGRMEGAARGFMLPAAALGIRVWAALARPVTAPLFRALRRALGLLLRLTVFPIKFLRKILEKVNKKIKFLFKFHTKWYIITRKFSLPPKYAAAMPPKQKRESAMKWKKSSFVLLFIVAVVIIYSAVNIVSVRGRLKDAREERDSLQEEIEIQTQKNSQLQEDTESLGEESQIREIARDKLGLIESGAVIFYDVGN